MTASQLLNLIEGITLEIFGFFEIKSIKIAIKLFLLSSLT